MEDDKTISVNLEVAKRNAQDVITEFSITYETIKTASNFASNIPSKIAAVDLIGGNLSQSDENLGFKLCENLENLMGIVGTGFYEGISVNLDFDGLKRQSEKLRAEQKTEFDELTEAILYEPQHELTKLKIKNNAKKIFLKTKKKLLEENPNLVEPLLSEEAEKVCKDEQETMEADLTDEFFEELQRYRELLVEQNNAKANMRKMKREKELAIVYETILGAYSAAAQQIVTKIKKELKATLIIQQLSTTITVRGTGEMITDPFSRGSLTGIYEILVDRYQKKTFVSFNNELVRVMSISVSKVESDSEPWKCLEKIEKKWADWRKKDLFSQMTPDHFWSAAFIRSLSPESGFRTELMTEVSKFIRTLSLNEERHDMADIPIFTFIKGYVYDKREFGTFGKIDAQTNSLNQRREAPRISPQNYVSPRKGRDIVENAAATTTTSTATTGVTNGKPFAGEVFKNQKISFTDKTGKIHTYVASRNRFDICPKCYPFSGNATEKCARPCFAAQCSKCKYFGHHASNCMQMYNVENGEPVTHA